MIVKNKLLNYSNKFIYQDDNSFLFSLDSLLLAYFVSIKLRDKIILDMCTGNAPIPMFLTFRTDCHIYGIEIQEKIFNLGIMSIKENNMNNQITLINDNIKNVSNYFSGDTVDIVVCNPPYFKYSEKSYVNNNKSKMIARHEFLVTLDDILKQSSYVLKNGGTFAMVHRPERFIEIITNMRKNNIEPKKIRFVHSKMNTEAILLLIEGMKGGKPGMKILSPLIIYDFDGEYSKEIKEMFGE